MLDTDMGPNTAGRTWARTLPGEHGPEHCRANMGPNTAGRTWARALPGGRPEGWPNVGPTMGYRRARGPEGPKAARPRVAPVPEGWPHVDRSHGLQQGHTTRQLAVRPADPDIRAGTAGRRLLERHHVSQRCRPGLRAIPHSPAGLTKTRQPLCCNGLEVRQRPISKHAMLHVCNIVRQRQISKHAMLRHFAAFRGMLRHVAPPLLRQISQHAGRNNGSARVMHRFRLPPTLLASMGVKRARIALMSCTQSPGPLSSRRVPTQGTSQRQVSHADDTAVHSRTSAKNMTPSSTSSTAKGA
jgi:hypothetical protein